MIRPSLSAVCFALIGWVPLSHAAEYLLGKNDVIEVKVFGEAEFSGLFRINSDGDFEYPYLRKIHAEGKTKEVLAKEINDRLKDGYLTDPQVNIEVKEFRSRVVHVLGAVGRPGDYFLDQDTKILTLISKAGGILPGGGKRVLLIRNLDKGDQSKPMIIDYYRLIHEGDYSQNIEVQDGDTLNIPKANEIFVVGNVARPGPVMFEENMTILQAVTLAGGPTPVASTKSTYILRQGEKGEEKIAVRFDKIMENKQKNVILKPDDVIVVPESFF